MSAIAVMQPYFFPYAGYFRLMAAADVFVLFDCVQFPRRGWVHRNRLPDDTGELRWLTLPLEKAAYDAPIASLVFRDDAQAEFTKRCRAFPLLRKLLETQRDPALTSLLLDLEGSPVDYLERTLRFTADRLSLAPRFLRSSSLGLPGSLKGQERVLAIVEALQGEAYVNLAGGKDYYDPHAFAQAGIDLKLLQPFAGSMESVLAPLARGEEASVRSSVLGSLKCQAL